MCIYISKTLEWMSICVSTCILFYPVPIRTPRLVGHIDQNKSDLGYIYIHGVSIVMGYPNSWLVYNGKSH